MRMISWNVNGIRASWNHGLSSLIDNYGADIYAFQETKTSEVIPMVEAEGYFPYWSFCKSRKGYSGTLVLTKQKPLNVRYDIGDDTFDTEGRIITLEFDDFFFVNCYVPNSQHSRLRYDYRTEWDSLLIDFLQRLQRRKSIIVCGDFNVPISDKDIYDQSKWIELNAEGFQSTERENLLLLTQNGLVDSFRILYPDETEKYTWWSSRRNKRQQNRGWRLDYFFVSEKLCSSVQESNMLTDVLGSDHCPIILEIDLADKLNNSEAESVLHKTKYTYSTLIEMEKHGIHYDDIKHIDTDTLPSSLDDVMELLEQLEGNQRPMSQKYFALSEFFRSCEKNSMTLTFSQIENIMGSSLGATALRKEFWYRTGFSNISQCWLDNGYEIKTLHLDGKKRVVFHLTDDSKNTASVEIPPVLKYQRVPAEAKYELENYCRYIIKKYGL